MDSVLAFRRPRGRRFLEWNTGDLEDDAAVAQVLVGTTFLKPQLKIGGVFLCAIPATLELFRRSTTGGGETC